MMECSQEYVEQWRLRQKAYMGDTAVVTHNRDVDQQRSHARQEMMQVLHSFLDGGITLTAFNTAFQQHIHQAWHAFHLQGTSGGMFLNRLVRSVSSEETFGHLLRLMIRVPDETASGRRQMQAFVQFLGGLIAAGQVTRAQLQPARVPFFLSAWWHIQNPQQWPIFYLSVPQALLTEQTEMKEVQNPVEAYFAFRAHFLALAQGLCVSSWELEHLVSWHAQYKGEASTARNTPASPDSRNDAKSIPPRKEACVLANRAEAMCRNTSPVRGEKDEAHQIIPQVSCRTHLQWLLARLGLKVGCRVWIAASDHCKVCQHERLGSLSLPSLPLIADPAFQQIIRQIDVLWLRENDLVAAYEIEQAHTDVSISLLRLNDLGALFPDNKMHLCVIAPQDRFAKVRFELSRPTFRGQETRRQCVLISEEFLLQQEAHMLRWASSPAVIEELISQASDGTQH